MTKEIESKNRSQWYSTDAYDDATSLQKWDDDGATIHPNYGEAYHKMMDEVLPDKET